MKEQPCPLCETIRAATGNPAGGCRFCQEQRFIQAVLDGESPWTALECSAGGLLSYLTGKAHLIYVDPLFWTKKTHRMKGGAVAFEDRFRDSEHFWGYLEALLGAAHRALAPEGSLVVHCDVRFQPAVRQILADLFGPHGFCDQVVWRYRRWPSKARRCQRMHDYLIRYALDPKKARWTQLYEPLSESTRETWGESRQKAMVRDGVRRRSIATDEPSLGAPLSDVWDIPIIAPGSKERTGYPTQKPEALLERVVNCWSLPGDLVVDPTMGSGTTLAVAKRLGRRAIGGDQSPIAVDVTRARLAQADALAAGRSGPLFTAASMKEASHA